MSTVDARFIRHVETIANDLTALLISKQRDYGPGNINNAYNGPMNGLLVRMGDKYERIKNLMMNDGWNPQHEPLRDSFADLANYCIIALMVLDQRWPTNEGTFPCDTETSNATPTPAEASTQSSSIV